MAKKEIYPGKIRSIKFPVVRGKEGEAFYKWLNSYKSFGYHSINHLVAEALKTRYMMDHLKPQELLRPTESKGVSETPNLLDQNVVTMVGDRSETVYEVNDLESILEDMFGSIKR